jgi:hypothetical protein
MTRDAIRVTIPLKKASEGNVREAAEGNQEERAKP